jgi:hypothetical protein
MTSLYDRLVLDVSVMSTGPPVARRQQPTVETRVSSCRVAELRFVCSATGAYRYHGVACVLAGRTSPKGSVDFCLKCFFCFLFCSVRKEEEESITVRHAHAEVVMLCSV